MSEVCKIIKNQNGVTTFDFLFAMVLIMGFGAILFAVSITLTTVEITQYMTFASARNYFASHTNPQTQEAMARQKYNSIRNNQIFSPLYSNGWFGVSNDGPSHTGDHTQTTGLSQTDPYDAADVNRFVGVSTNFIAPILDFNVPMFGSTSQSGDGSGRDFRAVIGSYLGREASQAECQSFINNRWQKILSLPGTNYKAAKIKTKYVSLADNGC